MTGASLRSTGIAFHDYPGHFNRHLFRVCVTAAYPNPTKFDNVKATLTLVSNKVRARPSPIQPSRSLAISDTYAGICARGCVAFHRCPVVGAAVATWLSSKGGKRAIVRHPGALKERSGLVGRDVSVLGVDLRWSGQAFTMGALM